MAMMAAVMTCLVVAISDGDTLQVRCGEVGHYEQVKIRLAEIYAPEKGQAHGNESKQALSDLCFQQMAKIKPVTTDRYGRTVAHVQCHDKDASVEQVRLGQAWVFDRYVTDRSLYELQRYAQMAKRGLWSDAQQIPPWQWRAQRKQASKP